MIDVPVTNAIRYPSAINAGTAASPSADDCSSWRRRPRSTRSRYRMLIDSTSRLESATGPTARRSGRRSRRRGKERYGPSASTAAAATPHAVNAMTAPRSARRPRAGRLGKRVGQPDHAHGKHIVDSENSGASQAAE